MINISKGNSKMGNIPNFSLPPGLTCSAECANTCYKTGCYARKFYHLYPSCRTSWDANLKVVKTDLSGFIDDMIMFLDKPRKKPLTRFRIHVSGDFFSTNYLLAWNIIASIFPTIQFLAFTKQFDILDNVIRIEKNLHIVLSDWDGIQIPAVLKEQYPIAYVNDSGSMDGSMSCPNDCSTCSICYTLGARQSVVFKKH